MTANTETIETGLIIDRSYAVLPGVEFTWTLSCWTCRAITRVTSRGSILAGLRISTTGKTCRWYQTDKPGKRPVLPAVCTACGDDNRPFDVQRDELAPLAEHSTLATLDLLWGVLRAAYPADAAKASAYDRRQAAR